MSKSQGNTSIYVDTCSDQFCKIPHTTYCILHIYIHTHTYTPTYILRTEWVITYIGENLRKLRSHERERKLYYCYSSWGAIVIHEWEQNTFRCVCVNVIFAVTIVSFWTQFRWDKTLITYYQKHKTEAKTNWYETYWTRLTHYDSRKWVNQLNCSLLVLIYGRDWVPSHLGICWPANS